MEVERDMNLVETLKPRHVCRILFRIHPAEILLSTMMPQSTLSNVQQALVRVCINLLSGSESSSYASGDLKRIWFSALCCMTKLSRDMSPLLPPRQQFVIQFSEIFLSGF